MTIQINGILEIDQERGVIYFHATETGHSPLRICSLPKPIPDPRKYGECLDITHMQGCSWRDGRHVICRTHSKGSKQYYCKDAAIPWVGTQQSATVFDTKEDARAAMHHWSLSIRFVYSIVPFG